MKKKTGKDSEIRVDMGGSRKTAFCEVLDIPWPSVEHSGSLDRVSAWLVDLSLHPKVKRGPKEENRDSFTHSANFIGNYTI